MLYLTGNYLLRFIFMLLALLYFFDFSNLTKSPTPGRHVSITVRETKTEALAPEGPGKINHVNPSDNRVILTVFCLFFFKLASLKKK